MNPIAAAIRPVFAFPDRNGLFQRIDQPLTGGKGHAAMGRTDRHRHARLADLKMTEPMHEGATHERPSLPSLGFEPGQHFARPFHYTPHSRAKRSAGHRIGSVRCPRKATPLPPLEMPPRPRRLVDQLARSSAGSLEAAPSIPQPKPPEKPIPVEKEPDASAVASQTALC